MAVPFTFLLQIYIDDVLLTASPNSFNSMLDVFNSFHERDLQFMLEVSDDNSLNFLDVCIIIDDHRIIFDCYKKPTFSKKYLNYNKFYSQHCMP